MSDQDQVRFPLSDDDRIEQAIRVLSGPGPSSRSAAELEVEVETAERRSSCSDGLTGGPGRRIGTRIDLICCQ